MAANIRLVTVVLEVADLDASLRLYRDGLGVDLHLSDHGGGDHGAGDRWISGRHAATSWTEGEFLHFALYESKGDVTSNAQLSLRVDDVDAALAGAVAGGAEPVHPPRDEPWGRSARVRDPDGNVIELTAPR